MIAAIDYFAQTRPDVVALVPDPARRILDVGCGAGMLGRTLLDRGALEIYGVEANEHAAARAKRVLTDVICGDAENIDIPWRNLDCIVCADVLEHLRDPWAMLRRLKPLLAPQGVLIASIPNLAHGRVIFQIITDRFDYQDEGILDRTHLRFFTKHTIRHLFSTTGYRIIEMQGRYSGGWKGKLGRMASLGLLSRYAIYQYLVVAKHA